MLLYLLYSYCAKLDLNMLRNLESLGYTIILSTIPAGQIINMLVIYKKMFNISHDLKPKMYFVILVD